MSVPSQKRNRNEVAAEKAWEILVMKQFTMEEIREGKAEDSWKKGETIQLVDEDGNIKGTWGTVTFQSERVAVSRWLYERDGEPHGKWDDLDVKTRSKYKDEASELIDLVYSF